MTISDSLGASPFTTDLDNLKLDPNNYRFIDHEDYTLVSGDDKLFAENIQRRTEVFILGKNVENIRDLIDSFTQNGWLRVDQIQVRESERFPGKYLVVEGNRRVAALKYLERRHNEAAVDLGKLDPNLFRAVPVNTYADKDQSHYRILMGLKHISGNKRWPALNQAKLLQAMQNEDGMSPDEICRAVGIRKQEFNLSIRTLALCEIYQKSDFGDQFRTEQFNLFQEVVKSRTFKKWLDWNDTTLIARNAQNLERFFSLISAEENVGDDDDTGRPSDPAITTSAQVRELAKIIEDPEALKSLERTRSLAEATVSSEILLKGRIERSLAIVDQQRNLLFTHARSLNEDDVEELRRLMDSMGAIIPERNRQPDLLNPSGERIPFNSLLKCHFTTVEVQQYRRLHDVKFDGLRRINLFAGVNNSGKTSILEAIYLLSQQNNPETMLEIVSRRGKFRTNPHAGWVADETPNPVRIFGEFDDLPDRRSVFEGTLTRTGENVENKAGYLATFRIDAAYGNETQSSETQLFSHRAPRISYTRSRILCPAVLCSPFSAHDQDTLLQHHKRSVENKSFDRIVAFLRVKIDDGIRNIYLTEELGTLRFRVDHRDFETAVDLTRFGEGIQRTFYVALAFAFAKNGIILIDEFENAVHASLLGELSLLIQELAHLFNIQVFITTHSKECVDAFIKGGCNVLDIAGYGMGIANGNAYVRHVPGETFQEWLDAFDADLRVVR